MSNDSTWFDVPMQCLYRGCQAGASAKLRAARGGYGINPPAGWFFYALGFPSALPNLGVCPDHQRFTVAVGGPTLDVVVKSEMHGIYYEIAGSGQTLGKITFPTNTLTMQLVPSEASAELRAAAPRVSAMIDFSKRVGA